MKKVILITLLITMSTFCFAQYETQGQPRDVKMHKNIDECLLRISYKHTFYEDTTFRHPMVDHMRLDIGNNFAKFYSNLYLIGDSVNAKLIDKKPFVKVERKTSSDYYFNYPNKGNLQTTRRVIKVDYVYDTPIENPKWEILADTATVLGYKCQKAIASYHGRTWEAWFTTEIPYQMGPWKLQGLPGLVLNAKTADNLFAYEAVAIEVPQNASIFHFDYKFKKISVRDMRKIERLMGEDVVSVVISHGATIKLYGDEGMVEAKTGDIAPTYIPQLELE